MKKICFAFLFFSALCFSISAQTPAEYQPQIEQYLNIRSAASPTFSPDGKRIAYLTNITGTSQVWMVDATGGYPEQITAYEDSVSFVECRRVETVSFSAKRSVVMKEHNFS
jgi:Tol biopolymer transport system component